MTKKLGLYIATFCLVCLMTMPISAQSVCSVCGMAMPFSAQTIRVKANIPFAFMIGTESMQAGQYMVRRRLLDRPAEGLLSFTNEGTGAGGGFAIPTIVGGGPVLTHNQPELIFHRYGDRYFLYQVWDGYSSDGFEIPPSRNERRAAKESAALRPENVVIVAMR